MKAYESYDNLKYYENYEYDKPSRYSILRKVVAYDEKGQPLQAVLETQNQVKVKVTDQDRYHIVGGSEVGRLDIIANKYYGNPTYWWMIAIANNIIDPFNVRVGDLLRIPSLNTIYDSSQKIMGGNK